MAMYIPNMKPEQFYDLCKEHGFEIIAIPAADVRPVARGKWTCHRTLEHDGDWWCTACGNELTIYMGNRPDRYNFCPNCGADMRPEPPKEE